MTGSSDNPNPNSQPDDLGGQRPAPLPAPPVQQGPSASAIAALALGTMAIIPLVGIAFGLAAFVCYNIASRQQGYRNGIAKVGFMSAIVFILVQIFIFALVPPMFNRHRGLSKRPICQSSLNGIGKAVQIYYADSNDHFPAIWATGTDVNFNVPCMTGTSPYALGSPSAINPLDNLSLLVYKGNLVWKMFLCPSTRTKEMDRSAPASKYGFGGPTGTSYCDYGLQIPYPYALGQANAAKIDGNADEGLAILADRPPEEQNGAITTAICDAQFSPNHGGEGESVLYADGRLKWSEDRASDGQGYFNAAGWGGNNIYLYDMDAEGRVRAGVSVALPQAADSKYDSVIFWRRN